SFGWEGRSVELRPGSQEHVATALHLASVLGQLLVDMDQRAALRPGKGKVRVFGGGPAARRCERVQVPDVGLELASRSTGSVNEVGEGARSPALGGAVALDPS